MYNSLLDIPFEAAGKYPDRISHQFRSGKQTETRTFKDFSRMIEVLTAGFDSFGIEKKDHAGFFMNNRFEWICTDFAFNGSGCRVCSPRFGYYTKGSSVHLPSLRFGF